MVYEDHDSNEIDLDLPDDGDRSYEAWVASETESQEWLFADLPIFTIHEVRDMEIDDDLIEF